MKSYIQNNYLELYIQLISSTSLNILEVVIITPMFHYKDIEIKIIYIIINKSFHIHHLQLTIFWFILL